MPADDGWDGDMVPVPIGKLVEMSVLCAGGEARVLSSAEEDKLCDDTDVVVLDVMAVEVLVDCEEVTVVTGSSASEGHLLWVSMP